MIFVSFKRLNSEKNWTNLLIEYFKHMVMGREKLLTIASILAAQLKIALHF